MPFPHYYQLDQMDCGPTCLRMIAKHYGRLYSLQSLREKAQIGKDGVSLLGMAEAAESIGFRSLGAKVTFEKLTEAPLPCIVHWKQNHFVVVYNIKEHGWRWTSQIWGGRRPAESIAISNDFSGRSTIQNFPVPDEQVLSPLRKRGNLSESAVTSRHKRGVVHVADPIKGLLRYSADDFCRGWLSVQATDQQEGIVLLLEPTPTFFEQEDNIKTSIYTFQRILGYLLQYKSLLGQLFLALIVSSGLQLLLPFLTQSVVDIGVNTQNLSFVYIILGAQLMLMLGRVSVEFIRSWILLHISTRLNLNILSDFLIKLMRLPLPFFDTKRFGDLMQRIGDHQRIETFLTGQTLSVLFSLVNLIVFGVVLATYNLAVFEVFVTASLLYIGWVMLFLHQRRKLDFGRFDVLAKNQSNLVQLIQGMQEIKLAGAERVMRWRWEQLQVRHFRLQMKALALSQSQQAGAFLINEGKNILITFLAAQAVINGKLTLGAMLAVQYIIGQLNGPIEQLTNFTQGLQDAKISLERLNEVHSLADEEPAGQPKLDQLPLDRSIRLQQLSFTYEGAGNEPVLREVDLLIPAGLMTAVVGMSGSGKTTLLKLLLKFYEPSRGDIRLGAASLSTVGHTQWRTQCGVVMQDGFIFSDTIARNIAVGVERIDAQRLEQAVHVANLREFVESLPSGYHTKIGAEGNGISQGQRQRILIARAVYKDPHYIFFDEATNALDANNEAIIMKNLNEFFAGRTVVVVAHRLSTVCNADQIVVLDKGKITEVGTHSQLVAKQGNYWQLVKNQLELGA